MRSVTISGLFAAFVTISLAGHVPSASAQDGPPPHIREAIDSVVQMLQGEGDASLDRFVDEQIAPNADFDRRELIESLGEMRERTGGLTDGISVEAEPDGLRLILEGGGRREQIRLVIEEGGIVSIGLLEGEQNTSYIPPPDSLSEDEMIRAHIGVIENSGFMDLNAFDTRMVEGHLEPEFVASLSSAERLALLRNIQAAASVAGGVMVNFDGDMYTVLLEGPDGEGRVTFSVQGEAPYKITSLGYAANSTGSAVPAVTAETLPQIIDDFERNGWSGLIFARVGGEMVLNRPFGQANAELGIPVSMDTIFGVGSRPIDFTRAAIMLLDQQGRLDLDDPITQFFNNVPSDKRSITVRHLMTGRSGLPDFFGLPSDWDQDLAWVDRDEAVSRMFSQTLLFDPGTDRRHSHGAFGMLAAIIEIVSGQDYYAFVRENFLDPAGMDRTGEYGESRGLALEEFAVGYGSSSVGVPNIPPNWGPTSWLVKGSGGMYSTLADLQSFYEFVRTSGVLDEAHRRIFTTPAGNVDGSERGFELVSFFEPGPDSEIYMFVNAMSDMETMRALTRELGRLAREDE